MRRPLASLALLVLLTAALAPAARALTLVPFAIETRDGERTGLLARPDDSTRVRGRPLVLLLHGHTGSAAQVLGQQKSASPMAVWLDIAERETLLVAALDGTPGPDRQRGWNDCRRDAPGNPAADDVGFVRETILRLRRDYGIDTTRIDAMGMSNGAMMTFRLALELKPPLAAFAAVCGSMADGGACGPPPRATSALIVAGTDDPLVPYHGGPVRFGKQERGTVIGIEAAVDLWRVRAGLPTTPRIAEIPHAGSDDLTHATRFTYGSAAGPQVTFVRIDGGGHVEPSASQRVRRLYERVVGYQNHDFEIAEEAWAFFKDKRVAAPAAVKPAKAPAKPKPAKGAKRRTH